ncbi:hypothetical protein ABZ250_35215 [Streptomyces afghaniensis]|uniref:hypothetical protein n=1 Tax=Streptomyces afghaniensis TaxID=66865 RepID=UPI0033B0FD6A
MRIVLLHEHGSIQLPGLRQVQEILRAPLRPLPALPLCPAGRLLGVSGGLLAPTHLICRGDSHRIAPGVVPGAPGGVQQRLDPLPLGELRLQPCALGLACRTAAASEPEMVLTARRRLSTLQASCPRT